MEPGQIILFIVVSVLIVVGAYYATYFLAARTAKLRPGRTIKLRDRFALSKDKSICMIEVKDKIYLIAMTNQSATLLDTLQLDDFKARNQKENPAPPEPQDTFVPQGFLQKSIYNGIKALKNSIPFKTPPPQSPPPQKQAEPLKDSNLTANSPPAPEPLDDLDEVYRRIQQRRNSQGPDSRKGD